MEPCCVCFAENYNQNDRFYCEHPLCNHCFVKLSTKLCPICRSSKMFPFIKVVHSQYRNVYIPLVSLIKHTTSYQYKQVLNKFLKFRTTANNIVKVNRYLHWHRFVLIKKNYYCIGEMLNSEFLKFSFINNRNLGYTNMSIVFQELKSRLNI